MALSSKSLFLYGLQVTTLNRSIDFKTSLGGVQLNATLTLGYYSLTDLMKEIKNAFESADPYNTYTVTADRTISGGTQNRVTISTSGSYLSLLFSSGSRNATTIAPLIGFAIADQIGATSYTGITSSGSVVQSTLAGYNYLSTNHIKKVFGSLNVSTTGQKEAVVFQVQEFFEIQFKYEPLIKIDLEWSPLLVWLIQQKPIEFTPEITSPSVFVVCTLEKTGADGKGLGYHLKEMLPNFPNLFDLGLMTFRKKV